MGKDLLELEFPMGMKFSNYRYGKAGKAFISTKWVAVAPKDCQKMALSCKTFDVIIHNFNLMSRGKHFYKKIIFYLATLC